MTILEMVKNTEDFRQLAFGKDTELLPYDDDVVKANMNTLINRAIYKGFKKAITDMVCEATKLEIREGLIDNSKLITIYDGYKKNIDVRFGNVLFITVNPRPDIQLDEFMKSLNKYVNKKWIEDYIYVIEQRGITEDESGKGFHSHLLIWKPDNKRSSEVIRETKNTFKKICSVDNPAILNIQNCKEDDIDKRKNYMLGLKGLNDDPTKEQKQKIDVGFRKRNNIDLYYSKNKNII